MPLITTTMPSLTGGVSQQPSSQRLMNQCEAQENAMPLLIGGLIKRPPTEHVAEIKSGTNSIDHSNSFSHIVTRDAEEEFMVLMDGSGAVNVVDTKGVNKTVYQDLGDSTYLQSSTPKTSFKAISIADVTFLVNTSVEVAMDSTKSPYSRGATAAKHEALIWIKTAGYGTEFKVYSGAAVVASFTGTSTAANTQPGSNDVARNLVDEDDNLPSGSSASEFATGTYNATNKGSVVHVELDTPAAFEMTVEDSLGDSAHSLIKSNEDGIMVTTNFNELPGIAMKDMIVKIEGDPDKEVDDYYVKFVPNDGTTTSLAAGIWEETVAPNVEFKYDYNTLPHILIRQSDGTFLIKRSNGGTPAASADANTASAVMDFKSRPASWNATTYPLSATGGNGAHTKGMSVKLKSTDGTEKEYVFTNFNRAGNAATTGELDTEDSLPASPGGAASTGPKCLVRCMLTPELQAEQFAYAINSANGHDGKIIAAVVGSKVTLTQRDGGENGNTEIIYGDMTGRLGINYYWSNPSHYDRGKWSFYGGGSPDTQNVRHLTYPDDVYPPPFGVPPYSLPVYNNNANQYFIGGAWSGPTGFHDSTVNVKGSEQGILDSQTIDNSATLSDYYLYNPELGSELVITVKEFGRGQWTTTYGDGALDVLKNTPANFTGGVTGDEDEGDGSPDYVPAGADYTSFKWADRAAGDDETNPLPSFVSKKINDISFFKNRLVVLAGENAIMSEVGGYFNFFRNTVTALLDSTVIDVGVGGTEVNELFQATPFSDRLILFSTRTQFALQGEAVLSPASASISQVTNFDVDTSVDPFTVGPSLFFAFNRGTFSGIREFYRTGDSAIQFDAMEASAQVPRYIKGPITKISASSHEDVVVMLGSEKDTLYVYKYFKSANGSLQSAWCKFILNNTSIVDMRFVDQSLFLVVVRDNKTYIEEMKIQTGLRDVGKDFTTHLDRRTLVTTSTDPGFTLTLPADYLIVDGDDMQVVDDSGELMTIESYTAGTNTITLKEELSPYSNYYVGVPYTMRYEISKPVLKRPKQGGGIEVVSVGRHQLRYMTVVYDDTSTFKVKVTPEIGNSDGDSVEYEFSGRFLSAGSFLGSRPTDTGDFRFPVFAESNSVKIEIINDTPLPSSLQAITFEASYTARSTPSGL